MTPVGTPVCVIGSSTTVFSSAGRGFRFYGPYRGIQKRWPQWVFMGCYTRMLKCTGLHSQLILSTGHPTWPAAGINGLWQAASGDNGFSRPADAFACLGACASLTRSDARSCSRGVGATQRRWPKGSSAWSARGTNNVLWLAHQAVGLWSGTKCVGMVGGFLFNFVKNMGL